MYIMCAVLRLFIALIHGVGALQFSIIIIIKYIWYISDITGIYQWSNTNIIGNGILKSRLAASPKSSPSFYVPGLWLSLSIENNFQ